MDAARAQREAVADGVSIGYSEAMVAAGTWRGRPQRFWRQPEAARPMTPQQAEAAFDQIAGMYPRAVVH